MKLIMGMYNKPVTRIVKETALLIILESPLLGLFFVFLTQE